MRTEEMKTESIVTKEGILNLIKAGYTEDMFKCTNLFLQYTRTSLKLIKIQNLLLGNEDIYDSVARTGYAAFACIEEKVDLERNRFELEKIISKRDYTLINATKKLLWLSSQAKANGGVVLITKRIQKDNAEMCEKALSDFINETNLLNENNIDAEKIV